ncbi:MAG: NAD(P)H-dependent oxidoreductase [Actinomycetaceae bacterium]|nr:NAD(P)H-dependent oxidoreductase [Actinomycetaceae bacterium]
MAESQSPSINATRDPFTPQSRRIVVVSGGLSESASSSRLARSLADATSDALSAMGIGVDLEIVELRPLATEIAEAMITMNAAPALKKALDAVEGADGIIAVSPTFQASYSGLFKSFWDLFEDPMRHKPIMLGATGGSARHSLIIDYAMRPLFSYLRMDIMPSAVFAASDDFGDVVGKNEGTRTAPLQERVVRAGTEFAQTLSERPALARAENEDKVLNVQPFEEMLNALR